MRGKSSPKKNLAPAPRSENRHNSMRRLSPMHCLQYFLFRGLFCFICWISFWYVLEFQGKFVCLGKTLWEQLLLEDLKCSSLIRREADTEELLNVILIEGNQSSIIPGAITLFLHPFSSPFFTLYSEILNVLLTFVRWILTLSLVSSLLRGLPLTRVCFQVSFMSEHA
jgi:hypothetical protein